MSCTKLLTIRAAFLLFAAAAVILCCSCRHQEEIVPAPNVSPAPIQATVPEDALPEPVAPSADEVPMPEQEPPLADEPDIDDEIIPPAAAADTTIPYCDGHPELATEEEKAAFLAYLASLPYYNAERAERYLAYYGSARYTPEQILRIVNTDNDLPRFTSAVPAELSLGDFVLVNKYHSLSADYVPAELVTVEPAYSRWGQLLPHVNAAFCQMVEAAYFETGEHLLNTSPYRSYARQSSIYNRYVTQHGTANADTYSARPGYSEHQTGLALDIITPTSTLQSFGSTAAFAWLRDNAHRFGFILRYGEGMEYITGYTYEPWHYRYVGLEAALFIYETGLTFEEYYAYYVTGEALPAGSASSSVSAGDIQAPPSGEATPEAPDAAPPAVSESDSSTEAQMSEANSDFASQQAEDSVENAPLAEA